MNHNLTKIAKDVKKTEGGFIFTKHPPLTPGDTNREEHACMVYVSLA